ncbi:DUF4393 domain-containing protein, partial [Clostridium perfringens]|uniref:DUF4393 domain-containing protein n=1 Tax=Clostridium perfringens TaxID=1502 RepID=UPI0013E3AD87
MNEFSKDGIKAAIEVSKSLSNDILGPSAKSIGKNLGLIFDGTLGWIGIWGEKQKLRQQKNINKFKEEMTIKVNDIPEENLKEPDMAIVGPAIESSRFFYEKEYYREMFSNLIAANCNSKKTNDVHPAFIEMIKQLDSIDARLLSIFKYNDTYPLVDFYIVHKNDKITPVKHSLFYLKNQDDKFELNEHYELTSALENLIRLGLVSKNSDVYELDFDYNKFEKHPLYISFTELKEDENDE